MGNKKVLGIIFLLALGACSFKEDDEGAPGSGGEVVITTQEDFGNLNVSLVEANRSYDIEVGFVSQDENELISKREITVDFQRINSIYFYGNSSFRIDEQNSEVWILTKTSKTEISKVIKLEDTIDGEIFVIGNLSQVVRDKKAVNLVVNDFSNNKKIVFRLRDIPREVSFSDISLGEAFKMSPHVVSGMSTVEVSGDQYFLFDTFKITNKEESQINLAFNNTDKANILIRKTGYTFDGRGCDVFRRDINYVALSEEVNPVFVKLDSSLIKVLDNLRNDTEYVSTMNPGEESAFGVYLPSRLKNEFHQSLDSESYHLEKPSECVKKCDSYGDVRVTPRKWETVHAGIITSSAELSLSQVSFLAGYNDDSTQVNPMQKISSWEKSKISKGQDYVPRSSRRIEDVTINRGKQKWCIESNRKNNRNGADRGGIHE